MAAGACVFIRLRGFNDFIVLGDTLAIAEIRDISMSAARTRPSTKSEVLVGQMYVWYQIPKQLETAVPGCVGSWRRSDRVD